MARSLKIYFNKIIMGTGMGSLSDPLLLKFNENDPLCLFNLLCPENLVLVNSRFSGHPRDRHLVSVIARVRNSGVR